MSIPQQLAQKPQRENIIRQLSKLGNTPYECTAVHFIPNDFNFFIPSSVLTEMRRNISDTFSLECRVESVEFATAPVGARTSQSANNSSGADTDEHTHVLCANHHSGSKLYTLHSTFSTYKKFPYLYNISNRQARAFYEQQGLKEMAPAFELSPVKNPLIMQCRHCLKFSLGYCMRHGGEKMPWKEPLYLKLDDGRRFRLEFQCSECQMNVYGAHPDPPKGRE
jgi:putative protease